jgi:hypothetical protein
MNTKAKRFGKRGSEKKMVPQIYRTVLAVGFPVSEKLTDSNICCFESPKPKTRYRKKPPIRISVSFRFSVFGPPAIVLKHAYDVEIENLPISVSVRFSETPIMAHEPKRSPRFLFMFVKLTDIAINRYYERPFRTFLIKKLQNYHREGSLHNLHGACFCEKVCVFFYFERPKRFFGQMD